MIRENEGRIMQHKKQGRTGRPIFWIIGILSIALLTMLGGCAPLGQRNVLEVDATPIPSTCNGEIRLAVLGDFGEAGQPEADVATLVNGWSPDYILTVGDNNYPDGEASTIDENIGQYFHQYIGDYQGEYGEGAAENRFFPALGNHDWRTGSIQAHLDYFTLPGNERYYDVVLGPVHLFVIDSDSEDPDGRKADSAQAQWLQERMAASAAPWKIVTLHHAPYYSGGTHGNDSETQWPYAEWGATAVMAGHEHSYERLLMDDIVYFVNGLGGRQRIHPFGDPIPGSAVRYNQDYGAMRVDAGESCITFSFYNRSGEQIDSYTLTR
jgi:hypothetical protein